MSTTAIMIGSRSALWTLIAFFSFALASFVAPANADIASFNAAIKANDYKAAAREAIETWPTLDKTRTDIGVIANEFGFAAYVAGEFEYAVEFAQFAGDHVPEGSAGEAFALTSAILEKASNLRLRHDDRARDALFASLQDRESFPGFELITFLGANALVVYDLENGDKDRSVASAQLAARLTAAGGESYKGETRRFELYENIAVHLRRPSAESLQDFNDLRQTIIEDMDTASTDEIAAGMSPVYWQTLAWQEATRSYLLSGSRNRLGSRISNRREQALDACDCDPDQETLPERVDRILKYNSEENCEKGLTIRPRIRFPRSQVHKGRIGSVIVAIDIDAAGAVANGRLLAAVPEEHFAEAVLERVPAMSYTPGKVWDDQTCRMAEEHRVIIVNFVIG